MQNKTQFLWGFLLLISVFFTACRADSERIPTTSTPTLTKAATPTPSPTITATEIPTKTATPTRKPTATLTSSSTPVPTPTIFQVNWDEYSPIHFMDLEMTCPTPKSLMLHLPFGTNRMEELAQAIIENNLRTITYRDVTEGLLKGECPPKDTIIVSIDDLGTGWLIPGWFPGM